MKMSPTAGKVLLHYYDNESDVDVLNLDTMYVQSFCDWLRTNGLIERANEEVHDSKYLITDKGRAMAEAMLSIPMPVQIWVIQS